MAVKVEEHVGVKGSRGPGKPEVGGVTVPGETMDSVVLMPHIKRPLAR